MDIRLNNQDLIHLNNSNSVVEVLDIEYKPSFDIKDIKNSTTLEASIVLLKTTLNQFGFNKDLIIDTNMILYLLSDGKETVFVNGIASNIIETQDKIIITIVPIFNNLNVVEIGDFFSSTCRTEFGSTACGKNLDQYSFEYVVTNVSDNKIECSNINLPSGYFSNGILEINKLKTRILNHQNTIITLLEKSDVYQHINIGSVVKLIAGCDKTITTCNKKFNNVINFRGECNFS